jgi:hypothetical protein
MTKRSHPRFPITGIATLQFEVEGKIKTIRGMLTNISSVGIGLYADNPIETQKQVSITLDFVSVDGRKKSVIEGSVVHNKKLGNIHFLGIKFDKVIKLKNHPLLYKHIKQVLSFNK